jgi:hypothetical protein
MSYSRDFESVRMDGPLIRVDATSIDDATGEPGTEDPATAFYVAIVKQPGGTATDVSLPVKPGVDSTWTAEFPAAAEHYHRGEQVYVIGVALNEGAAPDVWQETHTVGTRTG